MQINVYYMYKFKTNPLKNYIKNKDLFKYHFKKITTFRVMHMNINYNLIKFFNEKNKIIFQINN